MSVVVVTDSSAIVPPVWTDGLPVHVVPLEIAWPDGGVDAGDTPYAKVAERLRVASVPPRTGAPSPGSYETLFEELLGRADGVLVVCPAAELSTTVGSAMLAARELQSDRVRVIDARTAAGGQGIVTVEAARAAARGDDLDTVCARALDVADRMQVWATLSQLDFLRRSGRVPALAAIGADTLRLHPIVRYAGSSPKPVGVARSTRAATDRLFRAFSSSGHFGLVHALAFHSDRDADADELVARIASHVPGAEVASTPVTASLASHTGPGLLGLAWFWEPA